MEDGPLPEWFEPTAIHDVFRDHVTAWWRRTFPPAAPAAAQPAKPDDPAGKQSGSEHAKEAAAAGKLQQGPSSAAERSAGDPGIQSQGTKSGCATAEGPTAKPTPARSEWPPAAATQEAAEPGIVQSKHLAEPSGASEQQNMRALAQALASSFRQRLKKGAADVHARAASTGAWLKAETARAASAAATGLTAAGGQAAAMLRQAQELASSFGQRIQNGAASFWQHLAQRPQGDVALGCTVWTSGLG